MERLGVKVELCDTGKQTLSDGSRINLPPVLFGTLGNDKAKKTLLIYGHLDVQPAENSDGWNTEPFSLVEKVHHVLFIIPVSHSVYFLNISGLEMSFNGYFILDRKELALMRCHSNMSYFQNALICLEILKDRCDKFNCHDMIS